MSRDRKQVKREKREADAINAAQQKGQAKTYIDDDGCEVTALPSGHVLYNASDWW